MPRARKTTIATSLSPTSRASEYSTANYAESSSCSRISSRTPACPVKRLRLAAEQHLKRVLPLDFSIEFYEHRFDISAVERLRPTLHSLEVLLQHRPRSIS